MVLAVTLVALDCAALRFAYEGDFTSGLQPVLVVVAIPVVDALIVASLLLLPGRSRSHETRSFLWGFAATGFISLSTFAMGITIWPNRVIRPGRRHLAGPIIVLLHRTGLAEDGRTSQGAMFNKLFEVVAIFISFSGPLLLVALIGGAITRMLWLAKVGILEAVVTHHSRGGP